MAKSTKPKADAGVEPHAMMAGMMAANPVFAKAWMDVMSESARFMAERLQTDFETQKALMACKTPVELMQVQTDFFNTAMHQYAEETARLIDMTMKGAQSVGEDLKTGHSRGYDDIPV